MMTNSTLTSILNEKDVENLYRQLLTKKFGDIVFNSPFGCDGYGESKKHHVRLLCEFKFDLDLTFKVNQVKVLCQALYYIKKFELSGKLLPSVILIADRNECFAIHTNEIFNYLGMDFDWDIAPSNAHTNVELVNLMIEDITINPHVFNIKDIISCVDKIKDLTDGVKRLIPITPHNVTEVFKHFEDKVIGKHKLDTNQLANLFVQLLVNPDENYLHPVTRRKTVVTKAFNEVNLKSKEAFTSFFSHFSREYTPKQREHLTAVVDRLVQDVTRRKQGEFFTPTIWVDKAHEYITSVYGEDWREKYVVWDPAWGTGNLTRDYKFRELYVSTLNYSDIQTAEQMGFNPEAKKKFQFDFLNDPYEYLPDGLKHAIETGQKIIVLMNPPYAAGTGLDINKEIRKGMSDTEVGTEMSKDNLANSKQQLYTQFLYRCKNLGIFSVGIFSKPLFMSGSSYDDFRKFFMSELKFEKGFLMNSIEFSDVESWGLSFTIWGRNSNVDNHSNFVLDVLESKEIGIDLIGVKNIYNVDPFKNLTKWMRDKKIKCDISSLPTTNGLRFPEKKQKMKQPSRFLGYIHDHSNNVQNNTSGVGLYTTIFSGGHGCFFTEQNFSKIISAFTARRAVESTWINEKDEYLKPNVNHEYFKQFTDDSVVYSLFNNSSYQSSLKSVTYNDEIFNVKNQFFWMSKNEMTELANQNNYNELYNDARTDSDRYVYNLLFGEQRIYDQLSDEAKDVLDSATNLVRLSLGMRRNFADDTNHLNSWDAGYAQLKLLWKEYYPEQFKEFRDKYKVLEDKMRPMVYELGFLLK
jgi:hypothetical protein